MQKLMPRKSPFATPSIGTCVFVGAGRGPYENTRAALSYIDLSPARGKRVLLKPNAGRLARPGDAITTEPQVVAAAVDAFRDTGAHVAIGESPIAGVNALEAFEACGIGEIARHRDCPLIDMDGRPGVDIEVPDGLAINTLKICPEVLEYDLIVSMPVMKMHMHTGVTLSVKNMKGCLWKRSKVKLHMLPPVEGYEEKSINIAISDMSGVLRPHLSIIDGTVGMQGLGPSAGEAKELGVVVAGADPFAADAVACRLMGADAKKIPHLAMSAERGYGVIDLDRISVSPTNWQDLARVFEAPPENLSISFPNVNIFDESSCSACQSTVLLLLKRHGDKLFDYFPKDVKLNIAIGKGHTDLPIGTLCIGNCTAQHRDRGIFIKGCPPVGSEIIKTISGNPSDDTGEN
jgi:uncharacterized protein (DUF362 family)